MINRCRVKMSQKGLYKLRDSTQKRGPGGRKMRELWYHLYPVQAVYMNECLLGYEYLCPQIVNPFSYMILFLRNHLEDSYQPLSNSPGPSSLTHFLQIYCIGLIGPIHHITWAWTSNRDPTMAFAFCNLRFSFFFFFQSAIVDLSTELHFSTTFSLKMSPTALFIHLKIISLQCFQF